MEAAPEGGHGKAEDGNLDVVDRGKPPGTDICAGGIFRLSHYGQSIAEVKAGDNILAGCSVACTCEQTALISPSPDTISNYPQTSPASRTSTLYPSSNSTN